MAEGDWAKAADSFDATMKNALPPDKLQQTWQAVIGQQGSFLRLTNPRNEADPKFNAVVLTTEFERGTLDAKIVFDNGGRIAGLFFLPAKSTESYKSPAYVKASAFDEADVRVGPASKSLPGTISMPKGKGPFPAVVLVHGSGPQDRDQTIGPNKPFRDIAQGLATRGIAVIRYEKRTKQHPLEMVQLGNKLTVKQETVDDASAAVELLKGRDRIDAKRIFVAGHSLGGTLLPRIARENDKIAGFISLSGSARPLEDLLIEQTRYILSLQGQPTDAQKEQIKALELQIAKVKSSSLSPDAPANELPLGVPASYWLDLRGYDPVEEAKRIDKPFLVIHGARDYQVTMDDFRRWAVLRADPRFTFINYPTLNHVFMAGEGKSSPAEYLQPGHVDEKVIGDIVSWIDKQAKR
jgi:dienelactone hydrolase